MITLRKADERDSTRESWLDSRHTFSFHHYQDPHQMGFRDLRVINEDRVAPGSGFPMHEHRDMEIFSFIISGALKHEDNLGHSETIGPGELQRFTAGTGIRHSEYNPSSQEEVHFFQIWIFPEAKGIDPGYEKKSFDLELANRLQLILSRDGRGGSALIHQDVHIHYGCLEKGNALQYAFGKNRYGWIQLIDGSLELNETVLEAGDGATVSNVADLTLKARRDSRFFLFDLK